MLIPFLRGRRLPRPGTSGMPVDAESGQSAKRPPKEPFFPSDAHGSIRPFWQRRPFAGSKIPSGRSFLFLACGRRVQFSPSVFAARVIFLLMRTPRYPSEKVTHDFGLRERLELFSAGTGKAGNPPEGVPPALKFAGVFPPSDFAKRKALTPASCKGFAGVCPSLPQGSPSLSGFRVCSPASP